jgi:hypothetical protein
VAPSELAWLDFSEAEQRRAREAVQLFTQRDSRDELGTGVIRDIISDLMFPGISVLHQRARYFLFTAWLFIVGSRNHSGQRLLEYVAKKERELIQILIAGGDLDGLIGREVGYRLKTLPSTMYWNALQHFGVLRQRASKTDVSRFTTSPESLRKSEATEATDDVSAMWSPSIPPAPKGFPQLSTLDFKLSQAEEGWLRDRLLENSDGTLLQWLVEHRYRPRSEPLVWNEFTQNMIPPEHFRVVQHAKHFAIAVRGAALLYNYMLAEILEKQGKQLNEGTDVFHDEISDWSTECELEGVWTKWNRSDFWVMCNKLRVVPPSAVDFVEAWSELAPTLTADQLVTNKGARDLVLLRERAMKRARARLDNAKQLAQWGGRSGTSLYTYRWSQVAILLTDLAGAPSDV